MGRSDGCRQTASGAGVNPYNKEIQGSQLLAGPHMDVKELRRAYATLGLDDPRHPDAGAGRLPDLGPPCSPSPSPRRRRHHRRPRREHQPVPPRNWTWPGTPSSSLRARCAVPAPPARVQQCAATPRCGSVCTRLAPAGAPPAAPCTTPCCVGLRPGRLQAVQRETTRRGWWGVLPRSRTCARSPQQHREGVPARVEPSVPRQPRRSGSPRASSA